MPPHGPTDRRLAITADPAGPAESDLDQLATHRDLLDLLDAASTAAGLPRPTWCDDSPARAELPIDEPAPLAADRFVQELDAQLVRYNLPRQPTARLRLRLTIHCGHTPQTYALPLTLPVTG